MTRAIVTLCCFLGLSLPSAAAERVDYLRNVKPILKERCFACHGALKQQSKLRLDTAALIRRGGNEGPAVEPGKAADSLLIYKVSAKDEAERMPPEGKPLTAGQIAILKAWINQGAAGPKDEQPEEDPNKHWAFQRPEWPAVPRVKSPKWRGNPIDQFIAGAHERRGLKPVALVDKRLLLRRVYLDLIGLPPTFKEQHAFLNDARPDAYHRVVQRLLESPHYGERWGRHWMDIWRYSDWYGLGQQLRDSQKHIWHWRDWIVESLNADRGYDRMIVEMLAADEIAPTDQRTLRATGFLARNYYLFNRTTWLDNTIEHTSKAFLGLTMNCTKCHDHKYDPLTQVDYYRLRAIFEPHQVRLDAVPGETDLEKDGLPRVFDAHADAPTYLFIRGDEKRPDKSRVLTPGVPQVLAPDEFKIAAVDLPPEAHNPALQAFVLENHLRLAEKQIESAYAGLGKARQQLAAAEKAAKEPDKKPAGKATTLVAAARAAVSVAEKALAAARLYLEVLRAAHAVDVAKHRTLPAADLKQLVAKAALAARRFELAKAEEAVARAEGKPAKGLKAAQAKLEQARKAVAQPGDKYTSLRASLKALEGPAEKPASRNQPYPKTSTGRRTALARWIANRRNPLTARVAVNHIWLRHFGQPLVDPVTDFGRRAKRPHLHELLDWLAVDFMEHGWSMRHLHRQIVTSRAYQLSTSTVSADAATRAADPENHYHWRRKPVRMESQVIRDSLLHLAGVLDPKLGGPTIDPKKADTAYRRSLYFTQSRDDQHKFLSMFDDADILRCYRRSESIVPQQALALANSKLSLEMARKIAARLQQQLGMADDRQFIEAAYEVVLAVKPTAEEAAACREALEQTKEILVRRKHPRPSLRARENLVHALANHNDFITIR